VNHSAFPPELSDIATSLRLAGHRIHSRERLLVELAGSVDRFCALLEKEGGEPILAMFSRASSFVTDVAFLSIRATPWRKGPRPASTVPDF